MKRLSLFCVLLFTLAGVQAFAQALLPTATTVTAPASSFYGQAVTLTATITNSGLTVTTATGAVVWGGDSSVVSVCNNPAEQTISSGVATCTISTMAVGSRSVNATYQATGLYGSSTSPTISVNVAQAATFVSVSNSAPNTSYGQTETYTATISNGAISSVATDATGTVTWSGDVSSVCNTAAAQTITSGQATCSISTLNVAGSPHNNIIATYSGDSNYNSSASPAARPVNVTKAATTVALNSTPNPSTYLQSVTFTATITNTATSAVATQATGTVTWTGATAVSTPCNATLSMHTITNGVVTCTVAGLPTTSYTYNVSAYGGDTNFGASPTPTQQTQTVNPVTTSVSVVSSGSPSTYGSSVTFTATVNAIAGDVPTGTISWSTNTGCTTSTLTAGAASCTTSALPAGTGQTITATYSGDTNNSGSVGSTPQTVSKAPTTTTVSLSSGVNPSGYGSSVSFTATVTGKSPTGTVTWSANTGCPTATLSGAGTASCTTSSLPAGTTPNTITATYQGDGNNAGSSGTTTQTVNLVSTTVVVSSQTNPSTYGQPVTITATITGVGPTGTVSWASNAIALCPASAVSPAPAPNSATQGTATCTTTLLPVGSDPIAATYSGDSNNATSSGTLASGQAVNKANPTITVTSGTNPSTFGAQVVFSAAISAGAGNSPSVAASGSVTWTANGSAIASCNPATVTSGVATCTTTTPLAQGADTITATYSGDSNYANGVSPVYTQSVSQTATSVSVTSSANPSIYNQSVTFTATIAGTSPTGTVTWSANSTLITTCNPAIVAAGVATCATSSLPAGSNTISAAYSGDSNNKSGTGTFTQPVSLASQAITFNALSDITYGVAPFSISATASSNLLVAFTSNTTSVCTVAGSQVTIVGIGTCSITANQSGTTSSYSAAPPVTQTFSVRGPATITVAAGTPQSTGAGTAFPAAMQVYVKDALGNLVSGVPVTFTAPASGATALLSPSSPTYSTTVATTGGYASVAATAGSAPGAYSVTTSIQGPLGVNVTATATFALTNLAGLSASITGSSESTKISTTYTPLSVIVKDGSGNLVSDGTSVTFTVSGCPAASTLANAFFTNTTLSTQSCTDTEVTTNGIATTSIPLIANTAIGTFSVVVTSGGATTNLSLTNTAGSANSLVLVSGDKQLVSITSPHFAPLVVEVEDSFGNGVANAPVTFTITPSASGASASFAGSNVVQTSAVPGTVGQASLSGLTANNVPGVFTVTAAVSVSSGGTTLTGSYVFTLTNLASLGITAITPDAASEGSSNGVNITITGSSASGYGFGNSDIVQFKRGTNTTTLAGASVSSLTTIAATIPAALLAIPAGASPLTSAETETITVVGPDGSTSNPFSFILNPPPSGSTVSPTVANIGDPSFTLTINGSNFVSPSILITSPSGKSQTVTPSAIQPTSLTVPLPPSILTSFAPGVSGTVSSIPLSITIIDSGTTSTLTNAFSLVFPTISSTGGLSPASVAAGGVQFTLTVNGSNFLPGSVVHWCVSSCTPATGDISLTTTENSSSQLQAVVPASYISQAGSAIITVVNEATFAAQTASGQATFNFGGLQLNSVSPTAAQAGSTSSVTLALTGSFFQPDAAVHWVNGAQDTALATIVSTTSTGLSTTQLTASVPATLLANAGSASIYVRNVANNQQSNSLAFNIVQSAITSLSPASAPAGSPGITLTINGTNFLSGLSVQFTVAGASTALTPSSTSPTQITVVVPAAQLATAAAAQISVTNSGAVSSNSFAFAVNNPAITTLLPASVPVGAATFELAVAGTNFLSGSTVEWNNGTAVTPLSTTFNNSASLTAIVPASLLAATESVLVTVQNPVTGSATAPASNAVPFAVGPAPTILSVSNGGLSPSKAAAGSATFTLTLTGTNYTSSSVVQWDPGTGAANIAKLTTYLADPVNFTSLTATVPASLLLSPGTITVTVLNPGPVTSNPVQFVVTSGAAPVITSLTPSSTTAGIATAVQVTIAGSGFESSGSLVQFNAAGNSMTLTPTFVSPSQLNVSLPATLLTTAGNASISVSTPGGGSSNSVTFMISAPNQVAITSLQYATAAAGSGTLADTITGQFFVSGSVAQWTFGSTTTPITTQYGNSTTLTAIIPAADLTTPGVAFLSVLNPDKTVSNTELFTITGALPTIASLSQTSTPAGTSGLTLTVTGTGFTSSGTTVFWGATALPTLFVSATQVSVTLTSTLLATAGSVNVTVQAPGGTSNAVAFSVGAPTILVLSPSSSSVGTQGLTLNIGGQNFIQGASVMWATTALATTFVSSSQLTAVVPAALLATAGAVNVTVQNAAGAVSGPSPFTVGTGPAIASIAPASFTSGSGAFSLVIAGSNFVAGDQVLWNGVPLATTATSATALSASVPATLTSGSGSINIEVLHPDGTLSNLMQLTLAGPAITSLAPATAPVGSNSALITITGTNFIAQSVVSWNSTVLPTSYVSATSITAQVGSSLLQTPGPAFLTVSNGAGASNETPAIFTVESPTLSSLSPGTAVAGLTALSVAVTGTNFAAGSVVNWNGSAVPTSFTSSTQLTASVPASVIANAGTYFVTVSSPGGSTSGAAVFQLTAPPPGTITSFSPASAVAGSQAFVLTVTGTGFNSTSTVVWNGTSLPTTFVSATQITALVNSTLLTVPSVATVTVLNTGSTAATPMTFAVSGPTITSLSPTSTSAGGPAFTLSVTGTNYLPGSLIQWNSVSLPTSYGSATSLTASVSSSLVVSAGTASVTVQNPGGATSPASTFTVGPFTLSFTTVTLPDAIVGQIYSAPALQATGGTSPYIWSVTGGVIPQGLTLDPSSGTISGTATVPGIASLTIQVTDSVGRTASKTLSLHVVLSLSITNPTPLTSATISSSYSQLLIASGGTPPYTWSAGGSLPPGLVLNSTTGQISGTPTVPGLSQFTITVTDSRSLTLTSPFSLTTVLQSVSIGGITSSLAPAQQPSIRLSLGGPYTVDLSGQLTLSFSSAVGGDDQSIQFSTGGRTVAFTLPAGTVQPQFGQSSTLTLSTGTVAGNLTVTGTVTAGSAIVTPSPAPSQTGTVAKGVPVLTAATMTRVTGGLNISITGYSTTRDIASATLTFTAATGSTVTSAPLTVQLSSVFNTWYASAASNAVGSTFTITLPFTVTGDTNAIGSATITLTNSQGVSQPITATP